MHDRVDVDRVDELPAAPTGLRWVDFLGGTRNLRCYLVEGGVVRHELMAAVDDLDRVHDPVLVHAGVTVRQDSSYALPGFYVVALDGHVPALDGAGDAQTVALALAVREVRRGMREALGIELVHLHYEEKPRASSHVHQWLVPVHAEHAAGSTSLMRLDLHAYLACFVFREQRAAILAANESLRAHFDATGTRERLDAALGSLRA
ncbi:hypothetical protein WDV85_07940 [Pseudokineococcus sp. 5B2Z-1]|uniref:hypothetical protein n=1 Tax=Pseudokineococcus sp. 5B2Z-1 TaxID=3132744 RepID=UPI00309A4358